MRSDVQWFWDTEQTEALEKLKNTISSPPILALYDSTKDLILSVDLSSYGLGAVLMLRANGGNFKPVAFASRTLSASEKRYAQIEKEALAIAWGCEKFANYIVGKTIDIETDHKPLMKNENEKDLDN